VSAAAMLTVAMTIAKARIIFLISVPFANSKVAVNHPTDSSVLKESFLREDYVK
jgi:hypothetical protein